MTEKLKVYNSSTIYPDRAGITQLLYKDAEYPSRKDDVIIIPKTGYGLYILQNTSQFLLLQKEKREDKRVWFGGTDEMSFLVELDDGDGDYGTDYFSLWERNKFYGAIKPDVIKMYEKRYGVGKTVRQGDFFGYPLPEQNWGKIMEWSKTFDRQDSYFATGKDGGSLPLNETRHRFQGEICSFTGNMIAKGIITAPDHKPLELTKICVLAQTNHLKDAKNAD